MRSWKERMAHSMLFELGGLALVTPLASLMSGHAIGDIGVLAIGLASLAMLWNLAWNRLFDHWVPTRRRSFLQRLVQALGFESGLLVMTLPVVAWWLEVGWIEAFWLDLGFVMFFLCYAMVFNTAFDVVMRRRLAQGGMR